MIIEIMCPELCNLYGDMGNVDYLEATLGDDAVFVKTMLGDEPAFIKQDVDMIYLGSMSEKSQERIINKLIPYKARIEELIEKGTVILATGNAPEVFMDRIEVEDGTVVKAIGTVPYHTKRKLRERNNSLYLGTFGDLMITGYTSRFTFTYDIPENEALFRNIKGVGNEPESSVEGFRRKNFFGTNLLGPLLVMNPDFFRYILKLIGAEDKEPAFYEDARKAYDVRLEQFSGDIDFGTHC